MAYELKEYLNSINFNKDDVMKTDDITWEKKYPAYIVNKCLSYHYDTLFAANEITANKTLSRISLNSSSNVVRISFKISRIKRQSHGMKTLLLFLPLFFKNTHVDAHPKRLNFCISQGRLRSYS